jgi:hypothetical protein
MIKNTLIRIAGALVYIGIICLLVSTAISCEDVYLCGHELDA